MALPVIEPGDRSPHRRLLRRRTGKKQAMMFGGVKKFNQPEMTRVLADELGIPYSHALRGMRAVTESLRVALASGNAVSLWKVGTILPFRSPPRRYANPITGERGISSMKRSFRFIPSRDLVKKATRKGL